MLKSLHSAGPWLLQYVNEFQVSFHYKISLNNSPTCVHLNMLNNWDVSAEVKALTQ